MCRGCEVWTPTCGYKRPLEHPAGTRALPSFCLPLEKGSSCSQCHFPSPPPLQRSERPHACMRTHFSRSITEESSRDTHQTRRPLFPLGWEGHQKLSNHHSEKILWDNKTEGIRVKDTRCLNPTLSLPIP